jgi:hypothetical protein
MTTPTATLLTLIHATAQVHGWRWTAAYYARKGIPLPVVLWATRATYAQD